MTIFGASIVVNMCFLRQTLLSVCLVVPFAVFGQPVATNDNASTQEDVNAVFNIAANDNDATGVDPASIDLDPSTPASEEKTITTADGQFTVDNAGVLTFDPNQDFNGAAILTYTIKNLDAVPLTSAPGTITVTVNPVNDLPTITAISDQSINEDTPTSLPFTIGDVETNPSSLTLTGTSDNQTLVPDANVVFGGTGANRTVQVTPSLNASGTSNITITVSDGDDNVAITFQVLVNAVNDKPTITSIADQTINQNGQTGMLAFTVSDVESAPSALTVTGLSNNVTLVPNVDIVIAGSGSSKTVQVSPAAGQSGVATITLRVSDGSGFSETSFDVTVTPAVNNPPTITSIADQIIDEDNSTNGLNFTIGDVETAVGSLIVTRTSDNQVLIPDANVLLSGTGALRTVTVTPFGNLSGTANITITVSDGQASAQTTFKVTVNSVNDTPTISALSDQSILEDGQTGALSFNIGDVETAPNLLSVNKSSSNTTLVPLGNVVISGSGTARTVNVIAAANQSGFSDITLTVSDGSNSAQTVFRVNVTSVNDSPTISSVSNQTIDENTSTGALAVIIGDIETPAGTLTLNGSSSNVALIPNANIIEGGSGANRTVTITPSPNANGVATITLAVSDGFNTTETDFLVTVSAVNDPPTITSITDQIIPEDSQTGQLAFTIGDTETPAVMLTLTPTSSNLSLVPNSQVLLGGTGSLRNVNVIPIINQVGQTTITLEVSDGSLSSLTSFNVMVTALDDPPTITPISDQVINEDSQTGVIPFTVGDLETNPDDITVTGVSSNQALIQDSDINLVEGVGGNWTVQITPNPNTNGSATITLTVSDGTETTPLAFLVTVNAVNDVPVFTGGANQTVLEDAGPQSVSNWATGISDGDPELTQALTFDVTPGTPSLFSVAPSISATGVLTYTPAANANGSSLVTVSLSDNGSGVAPNVNTTADQTFTITVTAVNDAPSFTKGADQTVVESAGAQSVPGWATGLNDGDPEVSQTLSFTVTNNSNPSLFSVLPAISAGGTLSYTPAPGVNGSAVVTIRINDNGSGVAPNVNVSPTQTFNITVTPINDAPVFTKGPDQILLEDAGAQSISNWATAIGDGDPEVQALTFNVSNNNTTLFSVQPAISSTGVLTFTPAANANGTTIVTVTLSDDGSDVPPNVNTSAAQTFNITITAVNDAPVFVGGSNVTVSENAGPQTVAGWATGISDGDPEVNQTLTFNVSNNNTALFSTQPAISSGGTLTFTPTAGISGVATVTVTLVDNGSGTAPNVNTSGPQTFNITVTQINDAPVFTKGPNQSVNEDSGPHVVNGWATGISDGDPDQTQNLTFNVTNDNNTLFSAQPAITASGNLSYTSAPNAAGTATVTVTLSDDGPGSPPDVNTSAPQTFTIQIVQINDAPTVSAIGTQTIFEDAQTGNLGFTINDPETAATGLIVTATSSNTTLVPNSGSNIVLGGAGPSRTINIIPVANLNGSTDITISVSDGTLITTQTFTVNVTPVNDPPTITNIGNQSVVEDNATGALAFTIGDVETPAGSLTVTSSSSNTVLVPNTNVVIGGSGASRTVTVTPANNQTGTTTITLTVSDGAATTSTTFDVVVTPVDDPPTITSITNRTINEDSQTGNIAFTVGDPETAPGSLTVTASSSNTTIVPNANIILGGTGAGRTVNVIPAANQNGTVTITLQVSDGLNSTPTTFDVAITPVNDQPTITTQIPVTINEGQTVTIAFNQLTVVDPDNVYPTDFSLFVTGGTGYSIENGYTIRPNTNVNGVISVPIFVNDGALNSPIFQYQITVNSTNDPPQITAQKAISTQEDSPYSIQFDDLTVVDPDNLTYPTGFTMEILPGTNYTFNNSTRTFTPALNFNGSLTVNVRVNDGTDNSNTFPLVVTVTPVNDPPSITAQAPLSTNEDVAITLVVGNFTIVDPEPTTYTLIVQPSTSPDYTVAGNKVTPKADFYGTLSVPVIVSDGALSSAVFNAQITVNPVNDPPLIVSQLVSKSTVEDTPIQLKLSDLQVTDVDNTYPTGFTLIIEAGTHYTFAGDVVTPTLDYVGPLDVVVRVNDGVANSPQFLVRVDVTDDADAPVITGQNPVSLDEDTERLITITDLIATDSDTPTNQLTVSVSNGTNYTVDGNTVRPLPNYFGTLTVPVRVFDGQAYSNTFSLQVTVVSKNDKPVFNAIGNIVLQEDAALQTLVITGISPGPLESELLLPSVISDNTDLIPHPNQTPLYNGSASTMTITFKPEPNMFGDAKIRVRFTDPYFDYEEKEFTITVNPVNDAPTLQPISPVTIVEDVGAEQIITLTGITPGGGPLEASQTLVIKVSTNKPELFDVLDKDLAAPNGSVRVLPKANANGVAQITVRIEDSGPGTPPPNVNFISRTFNLTITPVNDDAKIISTPERFVEPGNVYIYNIEAVDVDGDPITLTVPNKPAWLTFTPGTNGKGTLSGTPPAGPGADYPIEVRAKDPTGAIDVGDYTLTVNSRPVLTPITITTLEDQAYTFAGTEFLGGYSDADGNVLEEIEITELPDPAKGRLTLNGAPVDVGTKILFANINKLVYTPVANSNGNDTIRWNARDGFMLYSKSDTYAVIKITPSNDAPIIRIPENYVLETDTLFYELGSEEPVFLTKEFEAVDPDGDNISGADIVFQRIDGFQYRSENDVLLFNETPKITGRFDKAGGRLTLKGSATAQEYVDAIRSIRYNYVNTRELLLDTRSVSITLSDGLLNSSQESRLITLIFTFSDLDIPTAFTPNGDQANETWNITSAKGTAQYANAEVKVYNKRGMLLFETKGLEKQWNGVWNGELLPSDTYFYTIELNYNKVRYKGTVTILR